MASSIELAARELAAKAKMGAYSDEDVQNVVSAVDGCNKDRKKRDAIRERAKERWGSEGLCEIDSDAVVSESPDGGSFVQAWVWIDDSGDE